MPPILRSVLAIICGFLAMNFVIIVLTVLCVVVLHLKSGHPTPGYLVFNVIYSFLAALAAGYVTALIAAYRPLTHGAVLAAIILAFGIFSYAHYTGTQPRWYQLLMMIGAPLLVLAGSTLRARSHPTLPA